MKKNTSIILIISITCQLALSACGSTASLPRIFGPPEIYAELRLGDGGKKQILLESDEGSSAAFSGQEGRYRHRTDAYFNLSGDGSVYPISEDPFRGYKRMGTITIDEGQKHVTIALQWVPVGGGEAQSFIYNGIYPIKKITHNPFYSETNLQ